MTLSPNNLNNMCIIEFDGYNGWEKYLVTYSQAITLIPILAPKLPSITITDYEYSKVSRKDYQEQSINDE